MEFTDRHEDKDEKLFVPTLNLDLLVGPLSSKLEKISSDAELINVLRPIQGLRALRKLHRELAVRQPDFQHAMEQCLGKMSNPVEGGDGITNSWIQGWATASGFSNVMRLNLAFANASATIDRKWAYLVAVISLYTALASFLASCIFGWLSLPS